MTKIFLIRHGQSTLNQQGLVSGGDTDPDLTPEGEKQAIATKQQLAHIKFDDVYSSNLIRASKTAEIIYGQAVPIDHQLFDLRERNMGSIDHKSETHLEEEHRARTALSHKQNWTYKHLPDMESNQEIASRIVGALQKIATENPGKTILVVTHGGAIRAAIMKLKNLGYIDVPNGSFKNAGHVEIDYDDGDFTVVGLSGLHVKPRS